MTGVIELHFFATPRPCLNPVLLRFRAGGFDMHFDSSGQPTRRVSLKSASYSFKTVFDEKDVQQMIAEVRSIVQRGGQVPKGRLASGTF